MGTLIAGIVIVAALAAAARSIYKDRKSGKCCGGDCGHCGGTCHHTNDK